MCTVSQALTGTTRSILTLIPENVPFLCQFHGKTSSSPLLLVCVFLNDIQGYYRTKLEDCGFCVRPLNLSNPASRVGYDFGIVTPVTSFSVSSYLFHSQTCERDVCRRAKGLVLLYGSQNKHVFRFTTEIVWFMSTVYNCTCMCVASVAPWCEYVGGFPFYKYTPHYFMPSSLGRCLKDPVLELFPKKADVCGVEHASSVKSGCLAKMIRWVQPRTTRT